jgi:hypothetical protein
MNAKKNAKNELMRFVTKDQIKAAKIGLFKDYDVEPEEEGGYYGYRYKHWLKVGHTKEQLKNFLNQLDLEYDAGYGGQELFGTVWLKDGTWLERGEYDGAEWWEHKVCPEIPDILK